MFIVGLLHVIVPLAPKYMTLISYKFGWLFISIPSLDRNYWRGPEIPTLLMYALSGQHNNQSS